MAFQENQDGIEWNSQKAGGRLFLEIRANKKQSFTTFKQSIHHKSKCRVVALQNKENEETGWSPCSLVEIPWNVKKVI